MKLCGIYLNIYLRVIYGYPKARVIKLDPGGPVSRVGYRLGFFRYRCQFNTFKMVPVPEPILRFFFFLPITGL